MSQKTYMYDTQWQALINAIDGGDTSAIATALGQIKTSVDGITTALGNLSTDVTQDTTQWTNLINAISSGGGGGGGNVTIDSTQWTNLLTSIDKGDTSALATALGLIKTSIDSINTSLGSLSADVTQDSTQWSNLVNAIANQSITVDLSSITSDVVSNKSTVIPADTVTEALDVLKSDLTSYYLNDYFTPNTTNVSWSWSYNRAITIGKVRIFTCGITIKTASNSVVEIGTIIDTPITEIRGVATTHDGDGYAKLVYIDTTTQKIMINKPQAKTYWFQLIFAIQ